MPHEPLTMWTITVSPSDFPDHLVARRWEVDHTGCVPTDDIIVGASLDAVRQRLQQKGMVVKVSRSPGDDPVILETWL